MPIRIGSNLASLSAQRELAESTSALSTVFERLSSGQRINKASDDAAGLAVASTLNASSRVYTKAMSNIGDAVSYTSIASGALDQLTSITQRQQELAEQAANGVYSARQREALHLEAKALTDEYNRIVESTSFNGIKMLDRVSTLAIQAGFGVDEILSASLGSGMSRAVGTTNFTQLTTASAAGDVNSLQIVDINGDGFNDVFSQTASADYSAFINDGHGNFTEHLLLNDWAGAAFGHAIADFNGDGKLDFVSSDGSDVLVRVGDGTGEFSSTSLSTITVGSGVNVAGGGDFNGDGKQDVALVLNANTAQILYGNGAGAFSVGSSFSLGGGSSIQVGDMNGDGTTDLLTYSGGTGRVHFGSGAGLSTSAQTTFAYTGSVQQLVDIDQNGQMDLLTTSGSIYRSYLSTNGSSFNSVVQSTVNISAGGGGVGDFNGDGLSDLVVDQGAIVAFVFGNGDGTFQSTTSQTGIIATGTGVSAGDYNNDGVSDVVSTASLQLTLELNLPTTSTRSAYISLRSQNHARSAITTLTAQLTRLSTEKGIIGAFQSRLDVAQNVLRSRREGYLSAESSIVDADIAFESAKLVSLQIKQQAGIAILGQANRQPALALDLLNAK